MDPVSVLTIAMMSGCTVILNGTYDVLLWPLTKTVCAPGHKMTTDHGCQDRSAATTDTYGIILALLCCVLSVGVVWWTAGALAASLLCGTCCLISLAVGLVVWNGVWWQRPDNGSDA